MVVPFTGECLARSPNCLKTDSEKQSAPLVQNFICHLHTQHKVWIQPELRVFPLAGTKC